LHNNHHAFPSSAKFSVRAWEFDLGWVYINLFKFLGLAKVRRVAPVLTRVENREEIDVETVRAVLINRMHVLRAYAKNVTIPVCREQLCDAAGGGFRAAKRLLVREPLLLDSQAKQSLKALLESNKQLKMVYEFRERLNVLWSGAHTSNEGLLQHFKKWIADAEASGVEVLQQFARAMRGAALSDAT
jgi:stearoyl-CoA desaturase (Delta-9 desaturase)